MGRERERERERERVLVSSFIRSFVRSFVRSSVVFTTQLRWYCVTCQLSMIASSIILMLSQQ